MTDKLELLDELKHVDEVSLLELLEITSEDLVSAFAERIEDKLPQIYKYLNE